MNNESFRLSLTYVTPEETIPEHTSLHYSFDDAFDEADDLAFSTVGFPLESWQLSLDFGDGHRLYYFYPNESDTTSRYRLIIAGVENE